MDRDAADVAGRLDELAVELSDQPAGELVVDLQQLPPAPIPEPGGPLGGGDDVGEQHCCQYATGLGAASGPGEELLDAIQGASGASQLRSTSDPGSSVSMSKKSPAATSSTGPS